jgi:hypothetical protein
MTAVQDRSARTRLPTEVRTPAARQLLEIELAGQLYGIPLHHVQEVVAMARLSGPPDLPGSGRMPTSSSESSTTRSCWRRSGKYCDPLAG